MLYPVRRMLYDVCCTPYTVRCMRYAVRRMLYALARKHAHVRPFAYSQIGPYLETQLYTNLKY